jgi:hypothetical protein
MLIILLYPMGIDAAAAVSSLTGYSVVAGLCGWPSIKYSSVELCDLFAFKNGAFAETWRMIKWSLNDLRNKLIRSSSGIDG